MTAGIESPESHYYRRLIVDAVRALDVVEQLPGVDLDRVYVHGISQGGGVALAAAALSGHVAGVYACVPFLCDIPRAVRLADDGPYTEIVRYLAVHQGEEQQVFDTLSYFDAVTFAERCTVPAVLTVASMDTICPPATVHAAFDACAAEPKELWEHPFNGHEGGGTTDHVRYVQSLRTPHS
jgi:cephalosporin-C deacetylase